MNAQDREYQEWLQTEYRPIAGGSDVDGNTGESGYTDSTGELAEATTETNGSTDAAATDSPILEIDGKPLTESDLRNALKALDDMPKLQSTMHKTNEERNILLGLLEQTRTGNRDGAVPRTEMQAAQVPNNLNVTGEQLREMLLDRPDEALAVMANLIQHQTTQAVSQMTESERAKSSFLAEHPNYPEVIRSQEFQQFKASHPHYNDVNAYFALQISNMRNQVKAAETEGFKKGEANTIKNMQAKGSIKVLTGKGAAPSPAQRTSHDAPMSHQQLLEAATRKIEAMRNA